MGCKDSCNLHPKNTARGVIPQKLSDLENDVPYVSQDEIGKYVENYLKSLVPKNDLGQPIEGEFTLRATVDGEQTKIDWVAASVVVSSPYYWGLVNIESADLLTAEDVMKLTPDGLTKEDKEYQYVSNKQRQVIAYPASFGKLSSIVHKETGFTLTSAFERLDLVINGINYYAYITYNSSTGTYTYIFKH